jgi:hypothetical protein
VSAVAKTVLAVTPRISIWTMPAASVAAKPPETIRSRVADDPGKGPARDRPRAEAVGEFWVIATDHLRIR